MNFLLFCVKINFIFQMIDDFIKLGIRVLMGQRMEIYFSNNFICPTEREYHNMVAHSEY